MEIGHVTVHPKTVGTGIILLTFLVKINNSTVPIDYKIRQWPGNTKMKTSMMRCSFTALLSWICIRGNRNGYLFRTLQNNIMCTEQSRPVMNFTKFLRERLRLCGVGLCDVLKYSVHSLKRGCTYSYTDLFLSGTST